MLGPPHNSDGEKIGDCRAVLTQITGVTDRGTDICSKRPHTCDACNAVSEATERTNLRQFISHELNLTELDGLELVDPITQSRTGYTHSPASRHIDLLRTDCLQCRYSELGRIVREHCSWRDVNVPRESRRFALVNDSSWVRSACGGAPRCIRASPRRWRGTGRRAGRGRRLAS